MTPSLRSRSPQSQLGVGAHRGPARSWGRRPCPLSRLNPACLENQACLENEARLENAVPLENAVSLENLGVPAAKR